MTYAPGVSPARPLRRWPDLKLGPHRHVTAMGAFPGGRQRVGHTLPNLILQGELP